MSSTDTPVHRQRAAALQAAFFASPNRCDAATISDDPQARSALQTCLKSHASGAVDRAVLLPFRDAAAGPTAWFVCANSMQMLRALQDEVRAFIGPSYAEERPQSRPQDAADQHALPLIEAAGWFSFRLDSPDPRTDSTLGCHCADQASPGGKRTSLPLRSEAVHAGPPRPVAGSAASPRHNSAQ